MLYDLNPNQLELAEYMSDLSEEAFTVTWMANLEYDLWDIKNGLKKEYGRLEIDPSIIYKLNTLSLAVNGWIYFDEEKEETFISLEEWKEKVKNFKTKI